MFSLRFRVVYLDSVFQFYVEAVRQVATNGSDRLHPDEAVSCVAAWHSGQELVHGRKTLRRIFGNIFIEALVENYGFRHRASIYVIVVGGLRIRAGLCRAGWVDKLC